MEARRELGDRGEALAERFFVERGAEMLARNWRCRFGEIDLLVRLGSVLHIVEVKTRAASGIQAPNEGISSKKRERLARAFEVWCNEREWRADRVLHQFDGFFVWNEGGVWRSFWLEGI